MSQDELRALQALLLAVAKQRNLLRSDVTMVSASEHHAGVTVAFTLSKDSFGKLDGAAHEALAALKARGGLKCP